MIGVEREGIIPSLYILIREEIKTGKLIIINSYSRWWYQFV